MPQNVDLCSRRFVCFPRQVLVILITVHREEHMRRGVGSARCLLRLRYLPPLQLAVVSRFSLRCWPSGTKSHAPVALVAVPYPPPAQAAIACRSAGLQVPSFGSSLISTTPPPRLKKNSMLSYCSACAVALPGECPLGTRFLHRFYIRWHIAQAPGQKFTSNRIRPIETSVHLKARQTSPQRTRFS